MPNLASGGAPHGAGYAAATFASAGPQMGANLPRANGIGPQPVASGGAAAAMYHPNTEDHAGLDFDAADSHASPPPALQTPGRKRRKAAAPRRHAPLSELARFANQVISTSTDNHAHSLEVHYPRRRGKAWGTARHSIEEFPLLGSYPSHHFFSLHFSSPGYA